MAKKVNINEIEFIENWKKGLSDIELASIFNCSNSYIGKYRRNLKLKANIKRVGKKILINKDTLIELINLGKNNSEIAKILKVTPLSVKLAKERFNLENKDERINKYIELTHEQKEVLFGSILGDAYVKVQQKNAEVIIQHSQKQRLYVEYLLSYLSNIPHKISNYIRTDIRTDKEYGIITLQLYANECFNIFREMFYRDKKIIPIKYLEEYYTPLAMAIHYCDDGWNEGNAAIFATCSFTKEELLHFKKFLFNKYGLETTIFGKNRLRVRACSFNLFKSLIKPYIPECMNYKIEKVVS